MYKPSTTYLLEYSNKSTAWLLCSSVKDASCVTDVEITSLSQMDARCSTVHMCGEGYRGTLNQCSRMPDVPSKCQFQCMCAHMHVCACSWFTHIDFCNFPWEPHEVKGKTSYHTVHTICRLHPKQRWKFLISFLFFCIWQKQSVASF